MSLTIAARRKLPHSLRYSTSSAGGGSVVSHKVEARYSALREGPITEEQGYEPLSAAI